MKKLLLLLALASFLPSYELTANCPKKSASVQQSGVQREPRNILQDPYVQYLIEQDRQQFQARCDTIEKALDVILPILACGLFVYFIGSGKN